MTVQEYAQKKGISERTVYRMIERGDVVAEKWQDRWQIVVESDAPNRNDEHDGQYVSHLEQHIQQLQNENKYLRQELSVAHETFAEERQRLDTIVMQLTKQLEQQTLLLGDTRNRSLWKRVKTALGFASS